MFCPRCRDRILENWSFCPRCGAKLASSGSATEDARYLPLFELFKDIERQVKNILGPNLSKDVEFFELNPDFVKKHPFLRSGGGFRIKITRAGDGPPTIDIKAFGDIDEKLAERIREAMREQGRQENDLKARAAGEQIPQQLGEKRLESSRTVSEYDEPKCTTRWTGDHIVVELELPGVASGKDVEVTKFGESIEIKAFAGDKGYFKILGVPADSQVVSRRFRKGKLQLKIG